MKAGGLLNNGLMIFHQNLTQIVKKHNTDELPKEKRRARTTEKQDADKSGQKQPFRGAS